MNTFPGWWTSDTQYQTTFTFLHYLARLLSSFISFLFSIHSNDAFFPLNSLFGKIPENIMHACSRGQWCQSTRFAFVWIRTQKIHECPPAPPSSVQCTLQTLQTDSEVCRWQIWYGKRLFAYAKLPSQSSQISQEIRIYKGLQIFQTFLPAF